MGERGVGVDHATLNRWVVKYAPLIAMEAHKRKHKTAVSWLIEVLQVKYLNNIIEQDHRFIKKLTRQMKGSSPSTQPRQHWTASKLHT